MEYKIEPICVSKITEDMLPQKLNTSYHDWQEKIINSIRKQQDDIVIEGLKRKGFEFDNHNDLELFIKTRCSCEDNQHIQQRIYFVDNQPFLLYDYSNEMDLKFDKTNREFNVTATSGSYKYL